MCACQRVQLRQRGSGLERGQNRARENYSFGVSSLQDSTVGGRGPKINMKVPRGHQSRPN